MYDQSHIDKIKSSFEKMQTRDDLLNLLNEVKPLIYGNEAKPFELRQLNWYSNPKLNGNRYFKFNIKKKSGGIRTIHAPVNGLKAIQRTLAYILQAVFEPHNAAMGFVRGRSIVDNARIHEGQNFIFNIDLKDFFPSIDQARVWKCLQLRPFNLSKESSVKIRYINWSDFTTKVLDTKEDVTFHKIKGRFFTHTPYGTIYFSKNFDVDKEKYLLIGNNNIKTKNGESLEDTLWLVNKLPRINKVNIASMIASLCCTEIEVERKDDTGDWVKVNRNVLPQGAPTSPVITNIVCQRLDFLLTGVAKRFGLKYSRYADDITFSSMHNVYQPESDFTKEIHRIINQQGFEINKTKTRLQKNGHRKEVTGLLVNHKTNVQKRYVKQLRMWLYYWERYGHDRAYMFFLARYLEDKGHVLSGKPNMVNVIGGKLNYLKMVKGSENPTFIELRDRYNKLAYNTEPISTILDLWEKEGIERAMEVFYSGRTKHKS